MKPTYRRSWAGNLLMFSDLTLGPSFKVKRWFTGFGELSFQWIQICIGSLMRRTASGGYYGFRFVTPLSRALFWCDQSQVCREPSLLKFTGYIHNHKILPGNIFGLILKNKMVATGVFRLLARIFVGPLEQRLL